MLILTVQILYQYIPYLKLFQWIDIVLIVSMALYSIWAGFVLEKMTIIFADDHKSSIKINNTDSQIVSRLIPKNNGTILKKKNERISNVIIKKKLFQKVFKK